MWLCKTCFNSSSKFPVAVGVFWVSRPVRFPLAPLSCLSRLICLRPDKPASVWAPGPDLVSPGDHLMYVAPLNIYLSDLFPLLRADLMWWCDKQVQETIIPSSDPMPSLFRSPSALPGPCHECREMSWQLSLSSVTAFLAPAPAAFFSLAACLLSVHRSSRESGRVGPSREQTGPPGPELQIPLAALHSASFPKNLPREHFSCVPAISQALQS